jgi:spore germination protein GerM
MRLFIYSIVNTLVELPYIKKVQFQIDGEAPPLSVMVLTWMDTLSGT